MLKKKRKIYAADLFCGGGGTSTGMINAFIKHGYKRWVLGVNHWDIAIATHELNHGCDPKPKCASVQDVKPREAVPGGKLDFLWASPECTNHSKAKGGRPKDEQSRATAWDVLKWAQELYIKRIYIENVDEFIKWGPVGSNGQPLKSKQGETFRAFLAALESLGYTVEYQIMNAADFGAPTSRRRLIIQAVRGKQKIVWPEPSHAKEPGLFEENKWIPARDIIDWSIPGRSIFKRKKPLVPNTLKRIYSGVVKYWGAAAHIYAPMIRAEIVRSCQHRNECPFHHLVNLPEIKDLKDSTEPFIVIMKNGSDTKDIDSPLPTMTTKEHLGLTVPFVVKQRGTNTTSDIKKPLPTVTTSGSHYYVAEGFITRHNKGDNRHHSAGDPLPVIDTSNRYGLAEPFMVIEHGQSKSRGIDNPCPSFTSTGGGHTRIAEAVIIDMSHPADDSPSRVTSEDNPLKTITTRNNMAVAEPLIMGQQSCATAKPSNKTPVPTIATSGAIHHIEPFINTSGHTSSDRVRSLDEPLSTIVTKAEHCIVEPLIVKYNGSENTLHSSSDPLGTVTCVERFGVIAGNPVSFDIHYRMLKSHELSAAMSFPKDYKFAGKNTDIVKQIGNAVPPKLAEALIDAALREEVA